MLKPRWSAPTRRSNSRLCKCLSFDDNNSYMVLYAYDHANICFI